jgi:hypothetical protein
MAEPTSRESGKRIIKGDLRSMVATKDRNLVVQNEELSRLIDKKLSDVSKSGINPAALDVDVTVRW